MIYKKKTMAFAAFAFIAVLARPAAAISVDVDYTEEYEVTVDGRLGGSGTVRTWLNSKSHRAWAKHVYKIVIPEGMRATIAAMQVNKDWNNGVNTSWSSWLDLDGTEYTGINLVNGHAYTRTLTGPNIAYVVIVAYCMGPNGSYTSVDYDVSVDYEHLVPDLVVQFLSLSPSPAAIDERPTLAYAVRNCGLKTADATSVAKVYVDGVQTGGDIAVGILAAGGGEEGTLPLSGLAPGCHTIRMVVDATGIISEGNEGNNWVEQDILVYERVPYFVRFDPNGGNGTMSDQAFSAGTEQPLALNTFTRTDSRFKGWSDKPEGNVMFEDGSVQKAMTYVRNDVVRLYAVWEGLPRSVTFDANGGMTDAERVIYSATEPCGSLPMAYMDFHSFVGWFTEPTGGVQVSESSMVKADCTLYAHYERTVHILHFNANGGSGTMDDIVAYDGIAVSIPQAGFKYAGKHFVGWSASPSGNVMYAAGSDWTGEREMTLYAKWEDDYVCSYSVDAFLNDDRTIGYATEVLVTNSIAHPALESPPLYDGPLFTGWEYAPLYSSEGMRYISAQAKHRRATKISFGGDIGDIAFAGDPFWSGYEWEADYDDKGEECIRIKDSYSCDAPSGSVGLYCCVRECGVLAYKYDGYCFGHSGTCYIEVGGLADTVGKNEFIKDKVYFMSVGGFGYPMWEQIGKFYCNVAALEDRVIGRVYPICFIQNQYNLDSGPVDTNIVLSAGVNWKATVNCDWITIAKSPANGHRGLVSIKQNNTMYERSAEITLDDGYDIPIVIKQAPGLDSAKIVFDSRGGEMETNVVRYVLGRKFEDLPVPTLSGNCFNGWYTTPQAGGQSVTATTVVEGDLMLYARWSVRPCVVTFDANGGRCESTAKALSFNDTMGVLPAALCDGLVFGGWTTQRNGGAGVVETVRIAGDTTLYAYWLLPASNALTGAVSIESGMGTEGGSGGGNTPTHAPDSLVYDVKLDDTSFARAQKPSGALVDVGGSIVGAVQVKVGKKSKGKVKISASATVIADGKAKKASAKALTLDVGSGKRSGSLVFKGIGEMAVALSDDGTFTLGNGGYAMAVAKVGGELPNGRKAFRVGMDPLPKVNAGFSILEGLLPDGVSLAVTGGKKLDAGKAASPKYTKDKATGVYSLAGLDDPKKPNLSGLKLSYKPKTGQLKGSFKVYATSGGDKPKLKKYPVNVVGFMVDGQGVGQATMKKPAAGPWSVTVE